MMHKFLTGKPSCGASGILALVEVSDFRQGGGIEDTAQAIFSGQWGVAAHTVAVCTDHRAEQLGATCECSTSVAKQ